MLNLEKVVVYFEEEEHIIRRLGAAAVSCWSELPVNVRETLLHRSKQVCDDEDVDELDLQLERFFAAHERAKIGVEAEAAAVCEEAAHA